MANVKIELNSTGVKELLKSSAMKSICEEQASAILQRVGSGYSMDSQVGKNRVNAMVKAESFEAMHDNLKNNTLLKAVRG